ncbi:MAG TPA: hypothetical protein VKB80_26305 [Kofleriaceae bacterium]|nr:hypothetical protein [Kofleriaceae bacterium]
MFFCSSCGGELSDGGHACPASAASSSSAASTSSAASASSAAKQVQCPHCLSSLQREAGDSHCAWCGGRLPAEQKSLIEIVVGERGQVAAAWPSSPWLGDPVGIRAPACPRCGEPVRRADSPRRAFMRHASAQPPWNASWGGRCESCAHSFRVVIGHAVHRVPRKIEVRPASRFYPVFDAGAAACGVELSVTEIGEGGAAERTSLFLSMAELARLLEEIPRRLAVCFEQADWTEDWT